MCNNDKLLTQSGVGLHSPLTLLAVVLDTDDVLCIASNRGSSATANGIALAMPAAGDLPCLALLSSDTELSVSLCNTAGPFCGVDVAPGSFGPPVGLPSGDGLGGVARPAASAGVTLEVSVMDATPEMWVKI